MSVDQATVRRVAKLARLKVEESQLPKLEAELNGILGWIEQLNEVDVSGRCTAHFGCQHEDEDAERRGDRRQTTEGRDHQRASHRR